LYRQFRLFLRHNYEYGRFFAVARRNAISQSPRQSNTENNSNNDTDGSIPDLEDNDNDSLVENNTTQNNEILNSIQQQVFNQLNQIENINNNIDNSFNLINSSWQLYLTEVFENISTNSEYDISNNDHDEVHNIDNNVMENDNEEEDEGDEGDEEDEEENQEDNNQEELYEMQILEQDNRSISDTESEEED
jgi:hypothetical protein